MPEHVKGLLTRDTAFLLCLENEVAVSHANGMGEFWYIVGI